jgi:hypothetical protein
MKKVVLFFATVLGTLTLMTSCDGGSASAAFRQVETIDMDHGIFNYHSIIEGTDAHSGKKFARVDSGAGFGLGYIYQIPDSLKGKVLTVNIDAWTRSGDLSNVCDIVVTCNSGDSTSFWTGCAINEFMKNPNEWSHVVRTLTIPASVTSLGNTNINVMMHNIDAKSYFDMDDLKVEYREVSEIN